MAHATKPEPTGFHRSPPIPSTGCQEIKKKKNDRKETFKRKRYNTIYVWFHFNVAVKMKEAKREMIDLRKWLRQ
jgi:hypothetical protein